MIDTDVITHELQKPGAVIYKKLVKAFGQSIVDEHSKEIVRPALSKIVFSDAKQLARLNGITHPLIMRCMLLESLKISFGFKQKYGLPDSFRRVSRPKLICVEIPLYFEANLH